MINNRSFDLFTDNAQDRTPTKDIPAIPLRVHFGDTEFPSYSTTEEFYRLLASTPSTTSAVNPDEIITTLAPSLAAGRDVIYLTMTSTLSATHQNAIIAADYLREQFPDRTIECVDTHCVSGGQGLIVAKAAQLKAAGATLQDCIAFVEQNWRKVIHLFTLNDVEYMYRGGRIGRAQHIIAGIASIVPILHFSSNCQLESLEKIRGTNKSYNRMAEIIKASTPDLAETAYLHHGDCADKAAAFYDVIRQTNPDLRIEHGPDIRIGPVIGTHVGPTVMAFFYFASDRDYLGHK